MTNIRCLRLHMAALCLLLASLLAAALAGCHQLAATSSDGGESLGLISVPPLLSVDMATLLTAQQVSDALATEVTGPQIYEEVTAHFESEDALTTADITLNEVTREVFDVQLAVIRETYTDLEEAPNLADAAFWSQENKELILYGKGYMASIVVDIHGVSEDNANLLGARQLASLVLDKR